jgi:hypothetical protein
LEAVKRWSFLLFRSPTCPHCLFIMSWNFKQLGTNKEEKTEQKIFVHSDSSLNLC